MDRKFLYLPTAGSAEAEDVPAPPEPVGVTPCPCCGYVTIPAGGEDTAFICPVCFWETDAFLQSDREPSDQNHGLSLRQARENYRRCGAVQEELWQYCRPPLPRELPEND